MKRLSMWKYVKVILQTIVLNMNNLHISYGINMRIKINGISSAVGLCADN